MISWQLAVAKPLEQWRRLFAGWVRTLSRGRCSEAAIFFDFRPVAGSLSLAPLEDILAAAETEKALHRASGARSIEVGPAPRFLQPDTQRPWHGRSEKAHWAIRKPGTGRCSGSRITRAINSGATGRSGKIRGYPQERGYGAVLAETFQFLLHLRLRQQLAALQTNQTIDHKVRLDALSALEHRHLREAFVTIQQVQDDVRASLHLDRMG